MVSAMAKDNTTKLLLKLLKHYELMLGYIANQTSGCTNARERRGRMKLNVLDKRRVFVEQSRKLLNDYLLLDDNREV
tara:strand:+ start:8633 stop:8863 length:231 start_codon:yes stop_codon:yes gene_type:complete